MAIAVNVAGPALIRVGTGAAGALENFGYTVDGARITTEGHAINVPGDENGGDDGPPIEIQTLGETARVRLEMTKYDSAIADKLAARYLGSTAGVPPAAGSLVFASGGYFRLTIHSTNYPINFPCATLCRSPIEVNKGTKYCRLILEFECYKNPVSGNGALAGVLYNQAVS